MSYETFNVSYWIYLLFNFIADWESTGYHWRADNWFSRDSESMLVEVLLFCSTVLSSECNIFVNVILRSSIHKIIRKALSIKFLFLMPLDYLFCLWCIRKFFESLSVPHLIEIWETSVLTGGLEGSLAQGM